MSSNGHDTLTVYHADRRLWQQLRLIALQKGSPAHACLNWAIRDWLVKHGSIHAAH